MANLPTIRGSQLLNADEEEIDFELTFLQGIPPAIKLYIKKQLQAGYYIPISYMRSIGIEEQYLSQFIIDDDSDSESEAAELDYESGVEDEYENIDGDINANNLSIQLNHSYYSLVNVEVATDAAEDLSDNVFVSRVESMESLSLDSLFDNYEDTTVMLGAVSDISNTTGARQSRSRSVVSSRPNATPTASRVTRSSRSVTPRRILQFYLASKRQAMTSPND